jgi:hypothetical protein
MQISVTDHAVEAVQGLMAYQEVRGLHPLELRLESPADRADVETKLFNRNRARARAAVEAACGSDEELTVWAIALAIAEVDWNSLYGTEACTAYRRPIDKIRFLKAVSVDLYPLACGCHALLQSFERRRCANRHAMEAASVVIDTVRKARAAERPQSQYH